MNSRNYVFSFVTSENQVSGFVVSKTGRRHLEIIDVFCITFQPHVRLITV